jgi:hypothetical protein
MPDLTLESLAKRVETLEHIIAELRESVVRPATVDWDSAAKAAAEIRASQTFDFDAIRKQDECDHVWSVAELLKSIETQ